MKMSIRPLFTALLGFALVIVIGGGGFSAGQFMARKGPDKIDAPPAPDPLLDVYAAKPPHIVRPQKEEGVHGLTPRQVRRIYNLPPLGGTGTIAIVDAFDDPEAENDLKVFSQRFGLPPCTTENGCFEKHAMSDKMTVNPGWALEIALDVQWAHAIAPNAKVLLVEAKTNSGTDLMAAVDHARARPDVVAISMSWGGPEFKGEERYDAHFTSRYGATFFASSGDDGHGVIWPASSPNVVSVGGTTVTLDVSGALVSETAWAGSGGGRSAYQPIPAYQAIYGIKGGKRVVPDVSYCADPASGFAVYHTSDQVWQKGWLVVGGTSAGAPQWAAIKSLGLSATNRFFYQDAKFIGGVYFRDIVDGTNGECGDLCTAGIGYDAITGLGSPLVTVY